MGGLLCILNKLKKVKKKIKIKNKNLRITPVVQYNNLVSFEVSFSPRIMYLKPISSQKNIQTKQTPLSIPRLLVVQTQRVSQQLHNNK
jgi:hypothetical protein